MKNNDYQNWSKTDLIKEIGRLKKRKKYGLVWEDKPEDVVELCKEKLPVVKEVKNKEIITDKNKPVNLLIEGDNYHSLSVLNYTHERKVDVIYIDPPYNKGNVNVRDFIYNDKIVDEEDPYRHSKWLSFMQKRLILAKNLLKNTGLIFISIDDTEMAELKLVMDEIFGEQNLLANLIWRGMHTVRNSSKDFNQNTEYILCYTRSKTALIEAGDPNTYLRVPKDKTDDYPFDDHDGRGSYKLDPLYARNYYKPYTYKFKNGVIWKAPRGNYPRYSVETLKEMEKNGEIVFRGKEPKAKRYLKDVQEGVPPNTLLDNELVGFNKDGTTELLELFGNKKVFDQPKPVSLIKYLLSIKNKKMDYRNLIILDFMAGSGTTGHAVLELNKEDGGNRQFIVCTNNENNICTDVCYPRIKKVIEGYENLKGEKIEDLGGNLKYFKTDFVDYDAPTDKNKIKLTNQATEMLCIKEGTFEEVLDKKYFKIFKNNSHYTGIIFDQLAIPKFKEEIKDIRGKFSVYVFSLSDETFDEEFTDVKQKIKLSPIPEAILRVYRRIFR
jgi:adenine-specific DNA-methyltransferase